MNSTSESTLRTMKVSRTARLAIVALAASALGATTVATFASASAPTIESANVPHFAGALVNQSSRSLYVLSDERGGRLHCTTSCLSSWLPLEVSTSVKTVSLGAGVKGKIGFVARGSKKQVTFNSFPIYTFVGDSGARQSHGEGIKAFGGTWTLIRAAASTPSATPFNASAKPPTTTTTQPPTTTTTTPPGGGGISY